MSYWKEGTQQKADMMIRDYSFYRDHSIAGRIYQRRRCRACKSVLTKKKDDCLHPYWCKSCQANRSSDGCCYGKGCGACPYCYGDCEFCEPPSLYPDYFLE